MMAVDGRRLVRAVVLSGLLLLVAGGSVGYAAAAGKQAQDERTLVVPAPRPGDRATYTAQEVVVDASLARAYYPGTMRIEYEWLPERLALDADYGQRLVHPLRSTITFRIGTSSESTFAGETTYDAATGAPVSETSVWTGNNPGYCLCLTGQADPGNLERERHYRYDGYQGQLGPCGTRVPFQGRAYDGRDFWLQGNCDWPFGLDGFTFTDAGWTSGQDGRERVFQAIEDGRFQLQYDEASPFPTQATAVLSEAIGAEYTLGRYFLLQRTSAETGAGSYTPVKESVFQSKATSVALAPRTAWGLDDSDVAHRFPLSKAYAAAIAEPEPLPGQQGTSTSQWLTTHPNAYLALAVTQESHDRQGQPTTIWQIAWTDGVDVLAKQVSYGPVGIDSLILPSAMGERATVSDWHIESTWPLIDTGIVPPGEVPTNLPRPSDLQARYTALTGDASPNLYAFSIACADAPCSEPAITVWAGSQMQSREGQVYHVNYADSALRPFQSQTNELVADGQGRMTRRWSDVKSQEAVFPPLVSTDGTDDSPQQPATPVAPAWVLPATPATATGISLAAALGALYYFWPTVKGALGGIGLFSRIEDRKVLEHATRRHIHEVVQSEPGIHFMALSRKTDLGRGTLAYHVGRLVSAKVLVERRTPGYTCYFAPAADTRHLVDAVPLLRSEGSRAVFELVRDVPGLSGREVARRLGRSASTVNYHLLRLQEAGLVLGEGSGMRLSPLGEQATSSS